MGRVSGGDGGVRVVDGRKTVNGWVPGCDMAYRLDCNTCAFGEAVEAEHSAYTDARHHEAAHPDHFVYITEAGGDGPPGRE